MDSECLCLTITNDPMVRALFREVREVFSNLVIEGICLDVPHSQKVFLAAA